MVRIRTTFFSMAFPILLWVLLLILPTTLPASPENSPGESAATQAEDNSPVPQATVGTSPIWSGQVRASTRLYRDPQSIEDSLMKPNLRVDLSIEAKKENAELYVKFRWDPAWQTQDSATLFERMINEAYVRGFLGSTVLEAGYLKVVWGKGDDVHVLDVLNATDYYDFVNTDYLDRRAAEWMVRLVQPLGEMHALELVWEPVTTPDKIPLTGPWKPYAISELEAKLQALSLSGFPNPVTAQALLDQGALVQEELTRITDGTYGIRVTGSSHGFDYGILYAYTYHRQPKVDLSRLSQTQSIYLTYDRVHCFGIEGATAWEGFNFRLEGGYFLTKDTRGTDPLVRNNSLGYVVGFDRDLWTDGANLNLQMQGIVPLHSDKIDRNPLDVEYRSDGKYTSHLLAGHLSDTILENKVEVKLSAAFGLEQQDLRIVPELTYEPFDDFQITARWVQYLGDRDTIFGQYRDSSFFEVGVSYRF